jgi:hypothetical protein
VSDDDDTVLSYCGALPGDTHLLAMAHAVDDGIVEWLAGRERQ